MADKPKPKRVVKGTSVQSLDVDSPEEGKTYAAKIVKILKTKAGEVFGTKAKDPERSVAVISFEADGISGSSTISLAKVPNAKSNLFKFMKRYRSPPTVGQSVQVFQDDDGFWRLAVE